MSRYLAILALFFLVACTSTPSDIDNVCKVFDTDDDWYGEARAAAEKWDASVPVMMAIMRRESGFQDDAKPARRWFLGFVPLGRPSSAYGYAQALDGTWEMYQKATGNSWADRDDFADAVDFIAWYMSISRRKLKFTANDAYRHALAYHEGWTGYRNESYKAKPGVRSYAQNVQTTAARYTRQLSGCHGSLQS